MSDGEEAKGSKKPNGAHRVILRLKRMFLMFISFHDLNRKSTAFLLFHPRFCFDLKATLEKERRRTGESEEKLSNFHSALINSRGMSIKNMCFEHFSSEKGRPAWHFNFRLDLFIFTPN